MKNNTRKKNEEKFLIDIPNWDKYQSVDEGGMQYIRLHTRLLHNPSIFELTSEQRWCFIALLLHAGCVGVPFELSPSYARVAFGLRTSCDFSLFQNHGLIRLLKREEREIKDRDRETPKIRWGVCPKTVDPEAWKEWTEYKRGSPAKATITKTTNLLANHSPEEQRVMVSESIRNGWKGIFPPKQRNGNGANTKRLSAVEIVQRDTGVKL